MFYIRDDYDLENLLDYNFYKRKFLATSKDFPYYCFESCIEIFSKDRSVYIGHLDNNNEVLSILYDFISKGIIYKKERSKRI